MSKRNRATSCIGLILLLVLLCSPVNHRIRFSDSILTEESTNWELREVPSDLATQDPIEIKSDADFETQNWPGNGTEQNPFRIADLKIDGSNPVIQISNTRMYFEIDNCTALYRTIMFSNISNGVISNCDFGDIHLSFSYNISVENCTVRANYQTAIMIFQSSGVSMVDNYVTDYYNEGIFVLDCAEILLENNTLPSIGRSRGIIVDGSDNATFRNNEIGNHYLEAILLTGTNSVLLERNLIHNRIGSAINMRATTNCTLSYNEFIGCGVVITSGAVAAIHSHWNHSFIDNTVNGKALAYWEGLSNSSINISPYGQVIAWNCYNMTFHSGIFSNCSIGIILGFSEHCEISGNSIEGNAVDGIYLQHSVSCNITNNILFNIIGEYSGSGIHLTNTSQCILSENEISSCRFGITGNIMGEVTPNYVYQGLQTNLTYNSIVDCVIGIQSFFDAALHNNTLIRCGVFGGMFDNINNTVNGLKLGYFANETGLVLDGEEFGQIILLDCIDIIIDGGDFSRASFGVQIGTSSNIIIQEVKSDDNLYGITVQDSNYTTFSDVEISNGPIGSGIYLYRNYNCLIERTTIRNYRWGIEASQVSNISIMECVISNNTQDGAYFLYANLIFPAYFHLHDSIIAHNEDHGLILNPPYTDTNFMGTISNNTLWNNGIDGLITEASNLHISGNRIYSNGLSIHGANNIIYNNEFGMAGASDYGANNTWDNSQELGNFWFPSVGTSQYIIPGTANSVDRYPGEIMSVMEVDPVLMEEGSGGSIIEWQAFALNPVSYSIHVVNSTDQIIYPMVGNAEWDGSNVSVSLDDFVIGEYIIRLTVLGEYGIYLDSEVVVLVVQPTVEPTGPLDLVVVTFGIIGMSLLVLILIIKKSRK